MSRSFAGPIDCCWATSWGKEGWALGSGDLGVVCVCGGAGIDVLYLLAYLVLGNCYLPNEGNSQIFERCCHSS